MPAAAPASAPIDWRILFASPAGRAARAPTWIAVASLFTVSVVYEAVAGPTFKLLTFSSACVLSKRLHDRGRSGWWAALVLLALALVWPEFRGGWAVLATPVMIWAVVELGLMAGEQGANRFGPPPLAG